MRISVIVPTFRRTDDLARCLEALQTQQRKPEEILVVVRDSDNETRSFLQQFTDPFLRCVDVFHGGQVAALNAGLDAATGEILMITDDDAVPRADWVARVEQHFLDDKTVGGVGGRDVVHIGDRVLDGSAPMVGTVRWFGRIVGNHHLKYPSQAFVDVLKGANMSYRAAAVSGLRFDVNLRGAGAQVGNDMGFSMAIRKRGWRLLYDPLVTVDHFPAQRPAADERNSFDVASVENQSFNTWWILNSHMRAGPRRRAALLWERMIGVAVRPGLLRGWLATLRRDQQGMQTASAAQNARKQAERSLANVRTFR